MHIELIQIFASASIHIDLMTRTVGIVDGCIWQIVVTFLTVVYAQNVISPALCGESKQKPIQYLSNLLTISRVNWTNGENCNQQKQSAITISTLLPNIRILTLYANDQRWQQSVCHLRMFVSWPNQWLWQIPQFRLALELQCHHDERDQFVRLRKISCPAHKKRFQLNFNYSTFAQYLKALTWKYLLGEKNLSVSA